MPFFGRLGPYLPRYRIQRGSVFFRDACDDLRWGGPALRNYSKTARQGLGNLTRHCGAGTAADLAAFMVEAAASVRPRVRQERGEFAKCLGALKEFGGDFGFSHTLEYLQLWDISSPNEVFSCHMGKDVLATFIKAGKNSKAF